MTYKERLLEWCDEISNLLGWDIDKQQKDWEEKGSRRIENDEGLKKAVTKAISEVEINYGRGISMLYDRIFQNNWYAGWSNYICATSLKSFTDNQIEFRLEMSMMIKKLIDLHDDWKENEFKVIIKNSVRSEEVDIDPSILEKVNELVLKNRFKVIKYLDGGDKILDTDQFNFSDKINMSTDLKHYFNYLRGQKDFTEKNPDQIFVTLFGKLDKFHSLYSNWIFTLHKGKSIWLITDQVSLDNPNQKELRISRASIWRDRESLRYSECDLPYYLFETLDDIRSKQKSLTNNILKIPINLNHDSFDRRKAFSQVESKLKDCLNDNGIIYTTISCNNGGSQSFPKITSATIRNQSEIIGYYSKEDSTITIHKHPEMLSLSFNDINGGNKTFALILVNEIIQYLSTQNLDIGIGGLSSEFINQKLLEGAKLDPKGDTRMKYWDESHKEIFNEIIETAYENEETCTGIIPLSYDLVTKSSSYDDSWLATNEKLESLSEWLILDEEVKKMQRVVRDNIERKKDEGVLWLNKMYQDNFDSIKAKMVNESGFLLSEFGRGSSKEDMRPCGEVYHTTGKAEKTGVGIGKKSDWRAEWCECERYDSKIVSKINVRHYKVLMWLFDMKDRKELHPYYRQYRSHEFVPYGGNSLLNQTHPYSRLTDPCSNRYPNGMTINFFLCGFCFNKIKQKEKLEIVL